MQGKRLPGFLLRIDGRVVSFHESLSDAQEAAKAAPEGAALVIQTTEGDLHTWAYDRTARVWWKQKSRAR
jgi:hypothetical protein